ncbi:MAG: ATP-binding protein, partial [Chloroflexota bacterium]
MTGGNAGDNHIIDIIGELRRLPTEQTWVEFKVGNTNPEDIGQYISALSNAAALENRPTAYVIWGIEDSKHDVVGTGFRPLKVKKGNQELRNWLLQGLSPRIEFQFYEVEYECKPVVLLEIRRAVANPTQFQKIEYIRVGSHRQRLSDHPQLAAQLWRAFDLTPFEKQAAFERLEGMEVLARLDYPRYFDLVALPLPSDRDNILARLNEEGLIARNDAGSWSITNLGAILFAKRLADFPSLARKTLRVIVYDGKGRQRTVREQEMHSGYAAGFEQLIDYVNALLPRNEVPGRALRGEVRMYPEIAVRELIANALVHQDFSVTGAGPMIEIFTDRMEITNPGEPLVDTQRFIDCPPQSRNEALASLMRRMGICEERGSGIDKAILAVELYQLPAPRFEAPMSSTRAVMFAHKSVRQMDRADRVRACYQHAVLRFIEREPMTNSSLRQRFGIDAQTPYQRLRATGRLDAATQDRLDQLVALTNPRQLRRQIYAG